MFILHSKPNLEMAAQEFTINLIKILEMNINLVQEKIGFSDKSLKLYHLESEKSLSFTFIEDQVQTLLNSKQSLSYSKPDFFNFQEHFRTNFEKAMKYIILPEENCKINSSCCSEDYGYCVSINCKNGIEMPRSILCTAIEPNIIRTTNVSLTSSEITTFLYFSSNIKTLTSKPLSALFLSPSDLNFQELLGTSKYLQNFVEIYPKDSDQENIFNDGIYNKLSSWLMGTYLSDFIILIIDLAQIPDLHHSDLILKYFLLLKDIDRPLFILHKTSETISYEYSFKRISELLESWPSDKVLLHEEITNNLVSNNEKLETIKDQMNDNLFDPDTSFDLSETLRLAFENTVEKILLIQNTRKRELLIQGETDVFDEKIVCQSQLENS